MNIDAIERAELEHLRRATRLAGLYTWSFELGAGTPPSAKATFTGVKESLGYEHAEVPEELVASVELLVVPEDRARVLGELQAHLDGTTDGYESEYRVRRKDGAVRWILAHGATVRDSAGHPIRISGISVDVTRLSISHDIQRTKVAEEEARRAVEQLRLATNLSGAAVWGYSLDEDGDPTSARSAFDDDGDPATHPYDVDGVPRQFAAMLAATVHPEDQERMLEASRSCIAGVAPMLDAACRYIAKDGSLGWHLVRGIVTRDDTGRPLQFMGSAVDITQLKQTQEELRRVRERLELAVLGSKACTWDYEMVDGDLATGHAVYNNFWELLGYDGPPPGAEGLGAVLELTMTPEDRLAFFTDMRTFLDGDGHAWEREMRAFHKDETDRWFLTRGVVSRDAAGKAVRVTGASIDITDRKLTEKALQESEERFRNTFENASVGMILTDLQGQLLEYNSRFCEFMGYSREELVGRRFVEFMAPDEVEADLERQRGVVRGEIPWFTRDKRYVRKDGSIAWGNITVSVIQRRADGTPAHIMGILQDITERKALEAKIGKAQARMELAMRGSDVAVFDGDIPGGNATASTWTHFNMWEPMGIDPAVAPTEFEGVVALAVHPDDLPAALEKFGAAIESRSTDLYLEHRVLHRDGSVRWRLTRGTFVYDDAGTLTQLIGTTSDITKLKAIEGELSRAREAAEAANRAKDEFLANVSHEIRTPMNAILGMTELALDSTPTDHQRQLLSTVRSAAKNLLTIINDLLDFSKIASGKLTLDRGDFSLRVTVGDTLRALAVRAHRKGLELLCRVRPDVPDALSGDAGRLRQVLMNLVGNAIKFTQRGEVEVEIATEPSPGPSVFLSFTVRDTGIGIARDKQVAIFRAFEQEDSSTTRKYGGTGLGLTISAQLASLMDGDITVQSAPGCGSTFRFTARFARSARADSAVVSPERLSNLPLLVDDNETNRRDATATASSAAAAGQPERPRPLRVLVAEDNELNVILLRELLSQRGHVAEFARDGRAALDLTLTGEFDLMLLDLHMPELDGFEVVEMIRDRELVTNQHLRIIALTARSSARDRERCLAAGMDEFLAKPIEAAGLWAAMDRVVEAWPLAQPASRGADPGLLDARAILRATDGQAAVLDKLRLVLRRSLPRQMSRIRAAVASGDLQELREAAHQLVGTVGAFSTVTAGIASTLEDAASRQDRDSCASLVERLGSLCDALLDATITFSMDSLSQ